MATGEINMQFSVSATNRPPRGAEQNGVDYHFLSDQEFRNAIADDAFLEYEEVYPGRFYGTLKSEIDRIAENGSNVVLDIDVNGGLRVKNELGDNALSIFIEPPTIEALRQRLEARGTDSLESIDARVDRARYEIDQAPRYDVTVVNDDLPTAIAEVRKLILDFLEK